MPWTGIPRCTLATIAGAELNGDARSAGSLEPNKFADIVAFDEDPMNCPIERLPEIRPKLTIVGGRAVYDPAGMLR